MTPCSSVIIDSDTVTQTVRRIWVEVLKTLPEDQEPHFFDLGGHSLTAIRVMSRLRREWGVKLSTRLIFEHPGLTDFTNVVREAVLETR
jgi:hypothetical protein